MENINQLLDEWEREAKQIAFDKLKQELIDKQDFQHLEILKKMEKELQCQ